MESHLSVTIRNLGGDGQAPVASRATHAHDESLGGWTMLVGIDFPNSGCWEVTGVYLGQVLSFIVETAPEPELESMMIRVR